MSTRKSTRRRVVILGTRRVVASVVRGGREREIEEGGTRGTRETRGQLEKTKCVDQGGRQIKNKKSYCAA